MNYYQALQRADGRWDFTWRNDDRVHRAGLCAQHEDGHATAEEAERHWYEYQLSTLQPFEFFHVQEKCAVCGAWTSGGLESHVGHVQGVVLCEAHRDRAGFEQARPFAPGVKIVSSW